MTIHEYLTNLQTLYKTGNAREHAYRGDLQKLLMSMLPDVLVTNEPARVECGAPDYVLTRKNIPIGYIEAKDIGIDLKSKTLKEQFNRYKAGLSNLIITDYLEFQFYKDGEHLTSCSIAKLEDNQIIPIESHFKEFSDLIVNFSQTISQTIKSPTRLAEMMAGKARLMADVIEKSLNMDDNDNRRSNLKSQMLSFQQMLIHDIDNKAFSDIYAQTIAYGMFAARYHDPTLDDFSRHEAANLIPKSNPFLRKLFQDIAGYDLDDRLVWIVEELVNIFLASDVATIMKDFGKATKQEDPVVHFYETFLAEYSPSLRKSRGVWYTPEPVVNFIVRSVDEILKTEFNLPQGLADTSKTKIKRKVFTKATADRRSKLIEVEVEEEVHKVQILDPATGTGTFLAEVVKHIYKKFKGQQGIWSSYVKKDLIPRLNGFEILMASYAMAHLKMDMLFSETGVTLDEEQRLRIYLTNSLEEAHPDTGTLFSSWLSDEADQANVIKRETPVMCVLGNPPYSVISSNKGQWILNLIGDYKKNLNERKINLDDDYIKFIRYGQHYIEKNGSGILAYISNNSFIDGLTHRQMRKDLLNSFDKIYILDLHGSSKKNETAPDGSKDENVFDIQQGVSINIFIKTDLKSKNELGKVYHSELFGKRSHKYLKLNNNHFNSIKWNELKKRQPNYFFVPRNYQSEESYLLGFTINDLFINQNSGIQTKNDSLTINFDKSKLMEVVDDFKALSVTELKSKYSLKDTSGWTAAKAKADLIENFGQFYPIYYRPFDIRTIYMTEKSSGFVGRPRLSTMKNFFNGGNYGLITVRQQSTFDFQHILISKTLMESGAISLQTKEWGYIFPLYIYLSDGIIETSEENQKRIPNLKMDIVKQIEKELDLTFTAEKETTSKTFSPIDILDYIYAVLHSPKYRNKYKEFLKIDFPRVPYPKDQNTFWQLVKLGQDIRQIHLLESPITEDYITQYPKDGDNMVTRKMTKSSIGYEPTTSTLGKVWINDEQYFDNVPLKAWEFYIGGYQPAQKWLKDRYGRELSFEDILHYQKIVVALNETDRLMKEIDKIPFMND